MNNKLIIVIVLKALFLGLAFGLIVEIFNRITTGNTDKSAQTDKTAKAPIEQLNDRAKDNLPVELKETVGLKLYFPHYSKIDLVCGKMPLKSNDSVIMVCAAAYTHEYLTNFSHSNIEGYHVSSGKLYPGCKPEAARGGFVFYNGAPKFIYNDWFDELKKASHNGGCGFAQDMMIHDGEIVDHARSKASIGEFRALCLVDGRIAIVDTKGRQSFELFITRLMKLGVKEAIYLDMGGWKHSWYRDAQGNAIDIYPNPYKYATNWITFYK